MDPTERVRPPRRRACIDARSLARDLDPTTLTATIVRHTARCGRCGMFDVPMAEVASPGWRRRCSCGLGR